MTASPVADCARIRLADLNDPADCAAITRFLDAHPQATPFHQPEWLRAVEQSTGSRARVLVADQPGSAGAGARNASAITAILPLSEIHSPIFGRMLAATGFAVGGGQLGEDAGLIPAAEALAVRLSCPTIELRGGPLPEGHGWRKSLHSHWGFAGPLEADDERQLLAIPRKQRAEVRKGLAEDLEVVVGRSDRDRDEHYAMYSESLRNLGTPVFPRPMFDAMLDEFGDTADILTVRHRHRPVASVLSLYWRGTVMPYWGGGTRAARKLRANDRMYFELMRHARARGCNRFDFGRSKTGSGAWHFKRNWGFTPEPLAYATWTAPGSPQRDADPTSSKLAWQIAVWRRLPLPVANTIGPWISRGLG